MVWFLSVVFLGWLSSPIRLVLRSRSGKTAISSHPLPSHLRFSEVRAPKRVPSLLVLVCVTTGGGDGKNRSCRLTFWMLTGTPKMMTDLRPLATKGFKKLTNRLTPHLCICMQSEGGGEFELALDGSREKLLRPTEFGSAVLSPKVQHGQPQT
jgi:hypothetical protein